VVAVDQLSEVALKGFAFEADLSAQTALTAQAGETKVFAPRLASWRLARYRFPLGW